MVSSAIQIQKMWRHFQFTQAQKARAGSIFQQILEHRAAARIQYHFRNRAYCHRRALSKRLEVYRLQIDHDTLFLHQSLYMNLLRISLKIAPLHQLSEQKHDIMIDPFRKTVRLVAKQEATSTCPALRCAQRIVLAPSEFSCAQPVIGDVYHIIHTGGKISMVEQRAPDHHYYIGV